MKMVWGRGWQNRLYRGWTLDSEVKRLARRSERIYQTVLSDPMIFRFVVLAIAEKSRFEDIPLNGAIRINEF
jgi:hypothetical protein